MVVWQGITEGGTAVPIQVTEEGRVVAEGQEGKEGPPGPPGPPGPQGEYGPGDDVDLGNITAVGSITADGVTTVGPFSPGNGETTGIQLDPNGLMSVQRRNNQPGEPVFKTYKGVFENITFTCDGNATFKGIVDVGDTDGTTGYVRSRPDGQVYLRPADKAVNSATALQVFSGGNLTTDATVTVTKDGSITAAGDKCGFTAAGELFLTSRGTRYKLVVAGGLVNAEPYTRAMELKEKAEAARSPRPADNVRND
tara:strand:+ start:3037 stop:3795 length:759 start_codon:yes stop_codon:yes gene_type:complete